MGYSSLRNTNTAQLHDSFKAFWYPKVSAFSTQKYFEALWNKTQWQSAKEKNLSGNQWVLRWQHWGNSRWNIPDAAAWQIQHANWQSKRKRGGNPSLAKIHSAVKEVKHLTNKSRALRNTFFKNNERWILPTDMGHTSFCSPVKQRVANTPVCVLFSSYCDFKRMIEASKDLSDICD